MLGAVEVAAAVLGAPLMWRRYDGWGATPTERSRVMPGDQLVPFPKIVSTRAITIDAPPERVWPWLAQIGQGRGGFYSFDTLENLLGCQIHSASQLIPQLQEIRPGDLIRLAAGQAPCFRVALVDPPRLLVLTGADATTLQALSVPTTGEQLANSWQWLLEPSDDCRRTPLVARLRYSYPRRQAVLWRLVEPVSFVMERRMLRGIKVRAERLPVATF